jgi:acyl carrier protein
LDETAILSTLQAHIASEILKQPGRHIAGDAPLISGGLIDSFSLVDLALYVEDTFGVHLEDTELNADIFDTLEQLTTLIVARRKA